MFLSTRVKLMWGWNMQSLYQGCDLWRNWFKLLSFSEQLIQPYLEGMRRTETGLLEVRDFLRVKLDLCGSRYRNLAPPFASVRDAAGTLPGPWRAANRMEVTWINCATSYNPGLYPNQYLRKILRYLFQNECGTVSPHLQTVRVSIFIQRNEFCFHIVNPFDTCLVPKKGHI